MKQSCNQKEKTEQIYLKKRELGKKKQKNTLTIRNFFLTLKNRKNMKKYKINIFKNETKREIQ
jgi:hypothetical protein